ncbi:MAG: alpha-2-macroglobulin family protein, partial [Limisphaerales bacterium]
PPAVVRPRTGDISHYRHGPHDPRPDLSDPNNWELGEVAVEQAFKTGGEGVTTNTFTLHLGHYRAVLETRDRAGQLATARLPLRVLDPAAGALGLKVPQVVAAPRWRVEPGDEFTALWGTGYESGRAFIEIERDGRMLARFWTEPGRTQQIIRQAVTEELRGGFTLHVTQVRENRALFETHRIEVPWSNKDLDLAWETFRSRLEPGQKEQWTLVIRGRDGTNRPPAAAELVAALYDASLDQFLKHGWPAKFGFWPAARAMPRPVLAAGGGWLEGPGRWQLLLEGVPLTYRHFPPGWAWPMQVDSVRALAMPMSAAAGRSDVLREERFALGAVAELADAKAGLAGDAAYGAIAGAKPAGPAPDPSTVTARRNLQETAFFLPQLASDSNGVVRLTFTMPEALTEWRFLGFAHDRQLRSGFLEGRTVTAKELMVQPNPPRFLREGDEVEFTVKVSNQSAGRQTGRVRLAFSFAQDGSPADAALGNAAPELDFDIPAKESRSFGWRIKVPDACGFLTFKATGTTGRLSDGEEGYLPVLSRRVFLTESLPLPIRGPGERRFTFASLKDSAASPSVRHESFTVQMVSNPAWYAVLALPYLMEFPHECSEQTFNRLYANLLARHIANSDPRIKAVFDQWRATPALDSPLEKNPELRNIALQETPWLRAAKDEAQARRNVAVLFEGNRLEAEIAAAQRKLAEMHQEQGWPWFPGGPRNEYLTLYIVTGFGRLRHLGAEADLGLALEALPGLDAAQAERHARLKKDGVLDRNNLDPHTALYLYGRSFFLRDRPVDAAHREAFEYWQAQARRHWLTLPRLSQGHAALALKRLGDAATPAAILKSLKERSVTDEEFGRFWRDEELSWSWHRAPIETHALMIEAFDEVAGDAAAVEELKVWLLKQKQTQNWRTTKATADAVYALLLRGPDLLASTRLVEVSAGGRSFTPDPGRQTPDAKIEPGTGFYQVRLPAAEVTPQLAQLVVKKADTGVAWGAAYWQYFEDLERVKPYAGTPLTITKTLFTRVNTKAGPVLQPMTGAVRVGDELVVRLEIRTDRDLEFVHLKDQRGSGTEPVNVLTQFKWQDGLGYFESTRDTASHFFIEYLPKGTYVFEYPVRVQLRGAYPAGFAEIQCMYAPEFNARSASRRLEVN